MPHYKHAIFVHGMQRSGNHAIINWIEKQSEYVTFLNNREPWRKGKRLILKSDRIPKYDSQTPISNTLIVSYEDYSFDILKRPKVKRFVQKREKRFGTWDKKTILVIKRDPFNLFASRLQAIYGNGKMQKKGREYVARKLEQKLGGASVDLWKLYAKEGNPWSYLWDDEHCNVSVNYNEWVKDEDIRHCIASLLDLEFTDEGILDVPKAGTNSSSFDGHDFHGNAQDMKVFERWKHFQEDPLYRKIFEDQEVWDLSNKVFGEIPGTEVLR